MPTWLARIDSTGTTLWYGQDIQGSVRLLWNNAGTIVGQRSFDVFGKILSSSGSSLDRYGYTGREWDASLGLQYNRSRMYDPSVGRFLQEDPQGFYAGDYNLYRYVCNSPLSASDPSGEVAWLAPTLIGGTIGGAINYGFYAYKNWGNLTYTGAARAFSQGFVASAIGGGVFAGLVAKGASPIFGAMADGMVDLALPPQLKIPFTKFPWISVKRKSRPWYLYVRRSC